MPCCCTFGVMNFADAMPCRRVGKFMLDARSLKRLSYAE
jgi:hypothetical protein